MNPSHECCHPTMVTLFWARLGTSVVGWWRHRFQFLPKHVDGWISCGAWIFHPTVFSIKELLTTKHVFSLLDVCCLSSLLTLGVEFMTSTAASQGGANKVFWIHYWLILWIKRSQQQQTTRGLHLPVLPPCKEKRVQGLYWKHTHYIHSSTTLLQFSRKKQNTSSLLRIPSLVLNLKCESSFS